MGSVPVFGVSFQHGRNQILEIGAVCRRDGRVLPSQDLHDQCGQALHKKKQQGEFDAMLLMCRRAFLS